MIPRRQLFRSITGRNPSRVPLAPPAAALPLTDFPGYAFSRSSDGDINSPEPFPFPGEGAEGLGELLLFPKPKQKWRLNQ